MLGPSAAASGGNRCGGSSSDVAATSSVALPGGRVLAYREYGDPSGLPVVFYHGGLNSRAFMPVWDKTQQVTEEAGCRIIAIDRPGYGGSTFHDGRTYMDNGSDLKALIAGVDGLGDGGQPIAVLGYSSGGPNALAAAHALALDATAAGSASPVAAVGMVSPDGPYVDMTGADQRQFGHGLPISPSEASAVADEMGTFELPPAAGSCSAASFM